MTRFVTALLVLALAGPAAEAQSRLSVGPERRISAPFTACCAPAVPAVWDGGSFGVFWTADGNVMARRVSASGEPSGSPVVVRRDAFHPVAASDGQTILLLTTRTDGRAALTHPEVLGADLLPVGPVPEEIPGSARAVVFDGASYVMASTLPSSSTADLWLSTLGRDGRLRASKKVTVDPPANPISEIALGTNGTEFVLAWVDAVPVNCGIMPCIAPTRLRVLSFDASLEPTRMQGEIIGREGYSPSVIWNGVQFVLLWTDLQRVWMQTLPAGPRNVILDPGELVLRSPAAWDGRNVPVLAGLFGSAMRATRLGRDGGALEGPQGVAVPRTSRYFTGLTLTAGPDGISLLTYIAGDFKVEPNTYSIVSSIVASDAVFPARTRSVRR